jgi:hypothetical protein
MKKPKRYERGGDVAESVDPAESAAKQRGLEESNKEAPVGFFERLRMGNIDDPNSEAYKRFGAGRGRAMPATMAPVEDRQGTPVNAQNPQEIESLYSSKADSDTSDTKPSKISASESKSKPAAAAAVKKSQRPEPKASAPKASSASAELDRPRRSMLYQEPSKAEDTPMSRIPGVVSDKGPTPSAGNSARGSDLERNVYNTMAALPGLAGISRAGAMGARAAQGARSTSRALSTGAETPVTFLSKTSGRSMNSPRLSGKSTDLVAKETVSGAKAAEKATSKLSGPQKQLAGPKDKADNVREAARKLSDRDKKAQGRASRDILMDRSAWSKGAGAMKRGGAVGFANGGSVNRRGDGIAQRGRTKGVMR